MTKLDQFKLLIEATQIFRNSGICPESPRSFNHWWAIVKNSHIRGFLYVGMDNGHIDLVSVGYRVKEITNDINKEIPLNEEGNVLYVPLLVSKSLDKWKVLKIFRFYLSQNPDVNCLAYYDHNSDNLKQFNLRRYHVV